MTAVIFRSAQIGKSSLKLAQLSSTGIINICSGEEPVPEDATLIFRWGCTGRTHRNNAKFVNLTKAIEWCTNKKQARLDMQAAGVPVPTTWSSQDFVRLCLEEMLDTSAVQFVVRPATHTQGKELFLGDVTQAALTAIDGVYRDGYVSAYVDKVAEYRVFVVSNRIAWVSKTTQPRQEGSIAWNYGNGENVYWSEWPMNVVKAALAAANVSGTDFCAIDVMEDAEGNAYVSECNTAPAQEGTYQPTCVAKCFDYIVTNGKDKFPDPVIPAGTPASRMWRYFIHPAIWSG